MHPVRNPLRNGGRGARKGRKGGGVARRRGCDGGRTRHGRGVASRAHRVSARGDGCATTPGPPRHGAETLVRWRYRPTRQAIVQGSALAPEIGATICQRRGAQSERRRGWALSSRPGATQGVREGVANARGAPAHRPPRRGNDKRPDAWARHPTGGPCPRKQDNFALNALPQSLPDNTRPERVGHPQFVMRTRLPAPPPMERVRVLLIKAKVDADCLEILDGAQWIDR